MTLRSLLNIDDLQWPSEGKISRSATSSKATAIVFMFLSLIFIWISVNIPIQLRAEQSLDDGLYLRQALTIINGNWLSDYNPRLLGKPPGFALFLAFNHLSGLPFSLTVALSQIFAAAIFSYGLYRITHSRWLAVAAYGLIIFSPNYFYLRLILRESVYPSIVITWVGLLLIASVSKKRYFITFLAGLFFGLAWITREDGIWMLPALPFLAVCFWRGLRSTLIAYAMFFMGFAAVDASISSLNYSHYGVWTTAEVSDEAFVQAVSALQSVKNGGQRSSVAVTVKTRQEIYKISPAFSTLRPYLEAPGNFQTCNAFPETCGEIRNGWFHWAIREAASAAGHTKDARSSADFYRSLSREVKVSCLSGELDCSYRPIAQLPNIHRSDIPIIASYFVHLWTKLLNVSVPIDYQKRSSGSEDTIAQFTNFLNSPRLFPLSAQLETDPIQIQIYGIIFGALKIFIGLMLASTVALCFVGSWRNPRIQFGRMTFLIISIGVLLVSRTALLAIIGATSFGTANVTYLSVCFPLTYVLILIIFWRSLCLYLTKQESINARSTLYVDRFSDRGERGC